MCKKLLFILFFACCAIGSMADTLRIVEPFRVIEHASVLASYRNEFGSYRKPNMDVEFPYALIRVHIEGNESAVTKAKERFALYLGQHYTTKAKNTSRVNEIMFLVPVGAGHVELQCGDGCQPLVLFDNPRLAADAIYEGKVRYALAKLGPTPTPNSKKQIFSFEVNPKNASVEVIVGEKSEYCEIDDDIQSITLNHGTYQYKVSAPRYQTETGIIQVSDSTRTKSVQLLPDFGWLTLSATESNRGASAYVINTTTKERIALGNIPLASYELDRGEYLLQIFQNKYKDFAKKITILPNQTIKESPVLEPNFISLTLSTDADSEILVNGESYGKGKWSGTLELGEYAIETRKANHRSSYIPLTLTHAEATQTITLASPTPIYGSLMVSGSPAKAAIYVDDKYVGESPMIVNDLLIGEHQIKVDKDGYAVWKKMVTMAENEEGVVTYELEKGLSLERIVLKGMNATNLSVKRDGDETLLFTYDLPKKGPVRLRMSTDGYTYVDQKNVKGAVGKEIDKGEGYQIAWTIPKDLGRTMQDSLYFQIVALPEFPKKQIKIGSLYYEAIDGGTSVEVARPYNYKKSTYLKYKFKKVAIPAEISYKGYKYSVTSIGSSAFDYCYKLTSINIPNSVTSIGKGAFEDCHKLTSITIPNSVTSIGDDAFESCSNLTSINIPNSVTSIGSSAFSCCFDLTSITIPNSVTSIGYDAFYATPWYKNYAKGRNVVYIGKVLYKHNNANLTSVVVKEGTMSITSYAFRGCKFLQSISIPNSVRYIDYTALSNCSSLAKITIDAGNPWLDSRDNCNAIIETKTNKLLIGCKNTVIPNSVTSIGNSAFEDCENLTSITIPNSVTSIGNSAFEECKNLTSITIPNSVTSIGNSAFEDCENLTSIIIPNSVTSIGDETFRDCINLTSITIPNSVTSIGWWAFNGCDNLSEINLPTGMEDKFNKMKGIKHFYEERDKKYSDGWNYYYGKDGVEQDYTKAVSYFRIAATQGHSSAQYYLGWCYHHNQGVTKDLTEAKKWYQKAAEQGDEDAKKQLANIQKEETEKAYTDGYNYYHGQNGVKQDYNKAVSYFRIAATQGHADAQTFLGVCYDDGLGVNEDDVEAVKWYRKTAEQGNKYGQYNLGNNYYYGEGVDKNYVEAVKWFRKAAEQGLSSAQYYLGWCYHHDQGVTKDLAEAKKWYQKAADQGHEDAKVQLVNIQKEETEKAYTDGYNYYHGQNGVKQDYNKAVSYFRIAATQGHANAQNFMGVCYDDGLGVNEDDVEAVKWFRKAAEQGDKYGQYNLGLCYQYGKGVTKNLTEAKKWYQQAADQGYEYAQNKLGDQYYKGEGVEQNYAEAVKWFRKAAEQGYKYAQFNLGLCYQYGNGVTKNLTEAKKWYQKAADQGLEDAKKKLKELQ